MDDKCPSMSADVQRGHYRETVRITMSNLPPPPDDAIAALGESCAATPCEPALIKCLRPRIALLSNPRSSGNIAQLPRIRAFCAEHPDIFHYEVEEVSQIGEAMRSIARVRPSVLAVNGGDGTVQAALTELTNGGHFGDSPPPLAVLPSGKTNLIALDLGARGDPIEKLLLSYRMSGERRGALKMLAVEEGPMTILRGLAASFAGRLGRDTVRGVHIEEADEIMIEGENTSVILDGEMFRAELGSPIHLQSAQPLSFVKLAA